MNVTDCTPMSATCWMGATETEVAQECGGRLLAFHEWMVGQTMALCDVHGVVIFRHDLERWLQGRQRIHD